VTGSYDQTCRLWQTATGEPLKPPFHHLGAVRAVAFSPDGRTILTGSEDNTARVWEVAAPLTEPPDRIMTGIEIAPRS
jgi:WD40 repeat protein